MLLHEAQALAEAVAAGMDKAADGPRALNAAAPEQESFVFRLALHPSGSVIAKVAAPGRLTALHDRLAAVHPRMHGGLFRVPEPYLYDAARGVLLMEDAWGMSAESVWRAGAQGPQRVLTAAGGWLSRYHQLSAQRTTFNPDPHLNWLQRSIAAHRDGQRRIPDFAALLAWLPELDRRAKAARTATSLRAITHRDFHLKNLLIRKHGRTYGIDMENPGKDEALRDLLQALTSILRMDDSPNPAAARAAVRGLLGAYGPSPAEPAAAAFFQHSFALNLWAGLDADALSKSGRHALQTAQVLLNADNLFAD